MKKYFQLYAAEDVDGVMSLWSEKSPEYATLKQSLQRQFTNEDYSSSDPVISRVTLGVEKASLRAITNLTVVNPKTNQKREQRTTRNFAFVREDGKWKVWRSAIAEEDLAQALAKIRTEAERNELLADEKELVTAQLAHALSDQGERFYNRGEYAQALTIYTLAKDIAEQTGDRSEVARTLHDIGRLHRSQGNFAPAMEYLQKSLALSETLGEQAGIARALFGIGMVNWLQGNYAQALQYYQKSLAIFETLNSSADIARVLTNMGNLQRHQADYPKALEYYAKSLAIQQRVHDTFGVVTTLGNIGVIYSAQGNYAKALDYYLKSLAMSEAEDDKQGIAITLGNIGVVHRKQGNFAQALDYYRKSLAMSEAIDDKVGISLMLSNIGTCHLLEGNYEQALDHYRKSLAMKERAGDKNGTAHTLMTIGVVYTSQGKYALAQEYYQKSLTIREAIGDRSGLANVLHLIAVDHNKQGHYSEALDFSERATTVAREIGSLHLLWSARVNAGMAYRSLNQLDKARVAFEEAIAIVETMRAQVAGNEQEQQRFFEDKLAAYHGMVDLLATEHSTDALIYAERAKARTLLDLLYSGRVNIIKAMTSHEQEQERTLRAEIISLNTKVTRANQQAKPDQTVLGELKTLREKARLNYEAFQTSLYTVHPELRVQRGEAPLIKATELAALLPDAASALLEFVVADDQTYLFVITKEAGTAEAEVRVYRLAIKRDELNKQVEAFRAQLARRDLGFQVAAAKLYEILLKPAAAQLRGKTNLIIAADDKLWDLPFQALLSGMNRFLIQDAAIAYAPSLTVLREMTKRRKKQATNSVPTTLLALGNPLRGTQNIDGATLTPRDETLDPLPEAEQEVKSLRQLYGLSRSKVYTGADAREDRVKSEAGQASILHFAAHGMLNNASPMYSHLALAQGGANEDGLLEAWEVTQLDLKADLAVLSACETARGRIGAGEGMIGLSWAMFIAGVPSIVVSQWKVESASTRELMVNFHRAMIVAPPSGKAKATKTEALQKAALKLLKNPATSHPFYWAGFVVVGAAGN